MQKPPFGGLCQNQSISKLVFNTLFLSLAGNNNGKIMRAPGIQYRLRRGDAINRIRRHKNRHAWQ